MNIHEKGKQLINGVHSVSNLAQIHPNAKVGKNVHISPFVFIDDDVVVGDDTWIGPNVSVFSGTRIGKNCKIFPGAVIGAVPQDLKFEGEYTTVEIGEGTVIRECVTINRGTSYAWKTVVGKYCLLMAYVHIAHDCILGNYVVLANSVNLAGHVRVDDWAILEGIVAVQQFVHIGKHSFVGGGALVRKNVPPYVKVAREPLSYVGVNSVGLNRRGFGRNFIEEVEKAYKIIYVHNTNVKKGLDVLKLQGSNSAVQQEIINFIEQSNKGTIRGFQSVASNGKNG